MEKMTIKQIRVGLNMTQKQMAKYLGISPASYTNKEIGKRRFYFDEVKRICELAKISIDVVKIEVAKAI
jgi:transcriptional regulator with XRE-family HTH domain